MASKGLSGYYKVAETKQGYGTYYYAIFEDGNTYEKGDKILVSGVNKEVLEITDILTPDETKRRSSKAITADDLKMIILKKIEDSVKNMSDDVIQDILAEVLG